VQKFYNEMHRVEAQMLDGLADDNNFNEQLATEGTIWA
jgi:hypothetical protein